MTLDVDLFWKLSAIPVCRTISETKTVPTQDGRHDSALIRVTGKASAQVGTSVVEARLPMSGELRSSGSHIKKPKVKQRIPPVHVRYKHLDEIEHVRRKAAEAGVSMNSYICSATLDHLYLAPIPKSIVEELRIVKRQLIGIGINLNQLMHRVNAGSQDIDSMLDYIDIVREPVLEAVQTIRSALSRRTHGPLP